jgi:hypothetical protein
MELRQRPIPVIIALFCGLVIWATTLGRSQGGNYRIAMIAAAGAIALSRPLNQRIESITARWNLWLARRRNFAALLTGLAVCLYLSLQAFILRGNLFFRIHDEHCYIIQARMLAQGKLWMSAFPSDISPFFDNFQLIVDRVYASIFFPGTALLVLPAIWLNLPYWVIFIPAASVVCAIFFLIIQDIFGGVRGLLAVAMLLSCYYFRALVFMLMPEIPLLLSQAILL